MSDQFPPNDSSAWTTPNGWGVPSRSDVPAPARPTQHGSAAYPTAHHDGAERDGQFSAGPQQVGGYGQHSAHPQQPEQNPAQYPLPGQHSMGGYQFADPFSGPQLGYPSRPEHPKRSRTWLAVTTAAVLAAALASGGTATLLKNDSPSSSSIAQTTPTTQTVTGSPNWGEVSGNVRSAVVAINVSTGSGEGQGSGVIIDDAGHILTNNHVIADADKVQVTMANGRVIPAEIVGTDAATDLAVAKLEQLPDELDTAALGSSADLEVGDPVMAVGNPLGLDSTVTTGIVSALDRPVSASDGSGAQPTVTNAIQIDAAVNPGNSGGPIFDSGGNVVGITSSIATMSEQSGSIGLGFAIPVDLAKNIATQLIDDGVAEHAFLGVTMVDGAATADDVTRTGAQVHEVQDGTPAAEAGIETDDVITAIDDRTVASAESLTGFVRQYSSGDEVSLTVIRDGQEHQVDVTLATRVEEE